MTAKRQHVLAVLHSDGFVEVFGEDNIDVKGVVMPHVPADEIAADEYINLCLPKVYRDLHWPNKVRFADCCRTVLPSDIWLSKVEHALIEAMKEVPTPLGTSPAAIQAHREFINAKVREEQKSGSR